MLVVPEDEEELEQQRMEQSVKEIRVQMRTHHSDMKNEMKDSRYQIDRILKTLKKVQEQVENN